MIRDIPIKYPRVLVFREKYGNRYFLIKSKEDFEKAALKVVKDRINYGFIYEPEALDTSNLVSEETLNKLIETVPKDSSLYKDIKKNISKQKQDMEINKEELAQYNRAKLAVDSNSGKIALGVIRERSDYEYEGWDDYEFESF